MNKQDLARDLVRSCKMIFNTDWARSPCKFLQDQWLARLSQIKQDQVRSSKIKQDQVRSSNIKQD